MGSVDDLIKQISEQTGAKPGEIKKFIEEKQDELSGLVSEEGAAYIVGRELGANLLREDRKKLKIKNVVSGMRSVDLTSKITEIGIIREFDRKGKTGRVVNVGLADETGTIRLSLWNEEVNLLGKLGLKEEDVIKVTGAFVKDDNRGYPNLMLGRGRMEKVEDSIDVPPKGKLIASAKRKDVRDLKAGNFDEVRASFVHIFRRNLFYRVCPTCGGRVDDVDGNFVCKEHGEVEPQFQLVLSGIIDDGTGNIRAVFFRDVAEKLFGDTAANLRKKAMKKTDPLMVYDDFPNIGKEYVFRGVVKLNNYTESLEFMVTEINEVDVKKELTSLLGQK